MASEYEYRMFALTRHFEDLALQDHPDGTPPGGELAEHLQFHLPTMFDDLDEQIYNEDDNHEVVSHDVVIDGRTVLLTVVVRTKL